MVRAIEFARVAHRGQRRKDGRPYVDHPLEVASRLADLGADEPVLIAAVLHDVVEHSDTPLASIDAEFGSRVSELTAALTEDPEISDWVARKRALRAQVARAGRQAAVIYAADKLTNLREMRGIYAAAGEEAVDLHNAPTLDLRVEAWRGDLRMVRRVGVPAELADDLEEELREFEAQRRRASQ